MKCMLIEEKKITDFVVNVNCDCLHDHWFFEFFIHFSLTTIWSRAQANHKGVEKYIFHCFGDECCPKLDFEKLTIVPITRCQSLYQGSSIILAHVPQGICRCGPKCQKGSYFLFSLLLNTFQLPQRKVWRAKCGSCAAIWGGLLYICRPNRDLLACLQRKKVICFWHSLANRRLVY